MPDGTSFGQFYNVRSGHLFYEDLDLYQLFRDVVGELTPRRREVKAVELVYLPTIRRRIWWMQEIFDEAIRDIGYGGQFHYAYASKANAAEEIIRTTLGAGAHHEMSSSVDIDIVLYMMEQGLLPDDRMVICNGFKPTSLPYSQRIIDLRRRHTNVIPIIEDISEIDTFAESGLDFEVGLRLKTYGSHASVDAMDAADSRFGFRVDGMWEAGRTVDAVPSLTLTVFHAMVGSQITDEEEFVRRLTPGMTLYAQMRRQHPTLRIFNFGGGMPTPLTLDIEFDYRAFVRLLLNTMQRICDEQNVPVPDIMGEFGRYTTTEHGAHLFEISEVKENNSPLPWYITAGSIMSMLPDSWALGDHFPVFGVNRLDTAHQRVRLGGITCDSDDIYPRRDSNAPLYLPAMPAGDEYEEPLIVAIANTGAYQEMISGARGAQHCVVQEPHEVIVDRNESGAYDLRVIPGQTAREILRDLGYNRPLRATSG